MPSSFSYSTVLYIDTCVNVQGLHMSSLPGYVVSSFFIGNAVAHASVGFHTMGRKT